MPNLQECKYQHYVTNTRGTMYGLRCLPDNHFLGKTIPKKMFPI